MPTYYNLDKFESWLKSTLKAPYCNDDYFNLNIYLEMLEYSRMTNGSPQFELDHLSTKSKHPEVFDYEHTYITTEDYDEIIDEYYNFGGEFVPERKTVTIDPNAKYRIIHCTTSGDTDEPYKFGAEYTHDINKPAAKSYYKDYRKIYIGDSDIAALTMVGCRNGAGLVPEMLYFGGDNSYHAYLIEHTASEVVEIGAHYKLVATYNHWLSIFDDSGRTYHSENKADCINVYRAGEYGCIIEVILPEE